MRRPWAARSPHTLQTWALAAMVVLGSGARHRDAEAAHAPPPPPDGGAASVLAARRGSPADAVAAAEAQAAAEAAAREAALPVLRLVALGGGARTDLVPFGPDGQPRPEVMKELSRLLAPRPTGRAGAEGEDAVAVDPRLAALLIRISDELEGAAITVVSGHRRPGRGTRKTSFHVKGMAVDIAVAGLRPRDVRAAAIRAGAGGVGLYPAFVHVDVRDEPYRWGGGGRAARRGR